jgi:hypothetical protein
MVLVVEAVNVLFVLFLFKESKFIFSAQRLAVLGNILVKNAFCEM